MAGGRRTKRARWARGTVAGMDESVTDRLISADVSAMNGAEMRAHLDAVQQQLRSLQQAQLALLDENPEIVAQRPELATLLDQLRAENPGEISGPGS